MRLLYDGACADLEHFRRNFLHYLISIIHLKFAQACIGRVSSSVYKDMGWSTFLFFPNSQFLFYPNKYLYFSVWLTSLSMIISSCIHLAGKWHYFILLGGWVVFHYISVLHLFWDVFILKAIHLPAIAAAAAKSLQSCPTLCDPIDGSPPGSPIPGILQERTLEWVAISFSNAWKWKVKGK